VEVTAESRVINHQNSSLESFFRIVRFMICASYDSPSASRGRSPPWRLLALPNFACVLLSTFCRCTASVPALRFIPHALDKCYVNGSRCRGEVARRVEEAINAEITERQRHPAPRHAATS